jgi:serine/threonine protein kinase
MHRRRRKFEVDGYISNGEEIGTGSFAYVVRGHRKSDGEAVAIKVIDLKRLGDEKELAQLKSEIEIQQRLRHVNLVRLYHWHHDKAKDQLYMVMEYCAGGDLTALISRAKNGKVGERVARPLMRQLCAGLQFLRESRVMHRDLKPANLLLTSSNVATATLKIADFGFARSQTAAMGSLTNTVCGTPLYMAPEILLLKEYGPEIDLWSVGAILYHLLVGHAPYPCSTPFELIKAYQNDPVAYRERDFAGVSEPCRHFLQGLLQKQPSRRHPWRHVFSHPWLAADDDDNGGSSSATATAEPPRQPNINVFRSPSSSYASSSSSSSSSSTSPSSSASSPSSKPFAMRSTPRRLDDQASDSMHCIDNKPLQSAMGSCEMAAAASATGTRRSIVSRDAPPFVLSSRHAQLVDLDISRALALAEFGDHRVELGYHYESLLLFAKALDLLAALGERDIPDLAAAGTLDTDAAAYLLGRVRLGHLEYLAKAELSLQVCQRRRSIVAQASPGSPASLVRDLNVASAPINLLVYAYVSQLGREAAVGELLNNKARSRDQYQRGILLLEHLRSQTNEPRDQRTISALLSHFLHRFESVL